MKRLVTSRSKTRNKLSTSVRNKGKLSLTKYFQKLKIGERGIGQKTP